MTPATKAALVGLGAGAAVGGVLLAVLVPKKVAELGARGAAAQQQIEHGGTGALATAAAGMRTRLQTYATTYASALAQRSANEYLLSAYGITEGRMQRIDRLATQLRPLFSGR